MGDVATQQMTPGYEGLAEAGRRLSHGTASQRAAVDELKRLAGGETRALQQASAVLDHHDETDRRAARLFSMAVIELSLGHELRTVDGEPVDPDNESARVAFLRYLPMAPQLLEVETQVVAFAAAHPVTDEMSRLELWRFADDVRWRVERGFAPVSAPAGSGEPGSEMVGETMKYFHQLLGLP